MKIYLAGTGSRPEIFTLKHRPPFMLESFFYIKDWQLEYIKSPECRGFLLDSGAFTLLERSNTDNVDFDGFTKKYGQFVRQNNIRHFFEMDIDGIVGLAKVEELRGILENEAGRQCIPVWHKSRGVDKFKEICGQYPYVSIGGIVARKEIKTRQHKFLHFFIREAHAANCIIHGLGFTPLRYLNRFLFDSVDSKSWLGGSIGASMVAFNGSALVPMTTPKHRSRKHHMILDDHNMKEWVKYVKFMEGKNVFFTEDPDN